MDFARIAMLAHGTIVDLLGLQDTGSTTRIIIARVCCLCIAFRNIFEPAIVPDVTRAHLVPLIPLPVKTVPICQNGLDDLVVIDIVLGIHGVQISVLGLFRQLEVVKVLPAAVEPDNTLGNEAAEVEATGIPYVDVVIGTLDNAEICVRH